MSARTHTLAALAWLVVAVAWLITDAAAPRWLIVALAGYLAVVHLGRARERRLIAAQRDALLHCWRLAREGRAQISENGGEPGGETFELVARRADGAPGG